MTSTAKDQAQDVSENKAAMKPQTKVALKFLKPWNRYYPSDEAGFDPKTAEDLIKRKIAEKVGK